MARIRTIKPHFWDDAGIGRLSRSARLLFIGLWTFADDLGVVVADTVWLKSKIFPYDSVQTHQLERWLDELTKNGFISLLSHSGGRFYYLPSFVRHQLINRPNKDEVNIPEEVLQDVIGAEHQPVVVDGNEITDESLTREDKERIGEKEEEKEEEKPSGDDGHAQTPTDYDKFRQWIRQNTPNVLHIARQITETEFYRLKGRYNTQQIMDILGQLDNYKAAGKKYTSVYRTLLTWAKKEYGN